MVVVLVVLVGCIVVVLVLIILVVWYHDAPQSNHTLFKTQKSNTKHTLHHDTEVSEMLLQGSKILTL